MMVNNESNASVSRGLIYESSLALSVDDSCTIKIIQFAMPVPEQN